MCVIATLPTVAIPELAKDTVTGVPSGSVTVYVKSSVKLEASIFAVVADKLIEGDVFTVVTLYQPPPAFMYNVLLLVAKYKLPLVILDGGNAKLDAFDITELAVIPCNPKPASMILVFD